MILHIAPDDKFIPFLQGIFEEASSGGNHWRILTSHSSLRFAVQDPSTERVRPSYFRSEKFKKDLVTARCVVLHSWVLSVRQEFDLLARLPKDVVLIWRGWGADYYRFLTAHGLSVLLPQTAKLIRKQAILNRHGFDPTREFLPKLVRATLGYLPERRLLSRFDYFACCVPNDFVRLQRALPLLKATFLPMNYYSEEDVFLKGDQLGDLVGNDILLGNSATASNNHIEALEILASVGIGTARVVAPLSYGNEAYQGEVVRIGRRVLGDAFIPLNQYLSLPEYNRVVSGCGVFVMNHVRQQAIGNVSAALLRGGRVFLRADNPIYEYYSGLGVRLFRFPEDFNHERITTELTPEEKERNKLILGSIWKRSRGVEHARTISTIGRRWSQQPGHSDSGPAQQPK